MAQPSTFDPLMGRVHLHTDPLGVVDEVPLTVRLSNTHLPVGGEYRKVWFVQSWDVSDPIIFYFDGTLDDGDKTLRDCLAWLNMNSYQLIDEDRDIYRRSQEEFI